MGRITSSYKKAMILPLWLSVLFAAPAICGELRDTQLPSEKRAIQQAPVYQLDRPQLQVAPNLIPESVYEDFRKETKGLKADEKGRLEQFFQKRLEQAKDEGRTDLVEYHTRLLQILKEK